MKFLAIFGVFLLFVNLSHQLPKLENAPSDYEVPAWMTDSCAVYTWNGDGGVSGLGCASYRCAPGEYLGELKQDNSKPYPDCCGGPICGKSQD